MIGCCALSCYNCYFSDFQDTTDAMFSTFSLNFQDALDATFLALSYGKLPHAVDATCLVLSLLISSKNHTKKGGKMTFRCSEPTIEGIKPAFCCSPERHAWNCGATSIWIKQLKKQTWKARWCHWNHCKYQWKSRWSNLAALHSRREVRPDRCVWRSNQPQSLIPQFFLCKDLHLSHFSEMYKQLKKHVHLEVRLARGPWPTQSLSVVILKSKQQPVPIFLFEKPNPTLTTYVFFELTMLSAQQNQTIQVGASGSRSESPVTGASEPEVSIFHKGGAKEPEFPNHAETFETFCFVWTSWVTQAPGPSRFRSPRTTP